MVKFMRYPPPPPPKKRNHPVLGLGSKKVGSVGL